jgi:hypothetical protein
VAVAGLGIAPVSFSTCRSLLAAARSSKVLADWQMEPFELPAVFAAGRVGETIRPRLRRLSGDRPSRMEIKQVRQHSRWAKPCRR